MIQKFETSITNLPAQPNPAGEKLILRSSAADTRKVFLAGVAGGTVATETVTLTGTREVQTTHAFESLLSTSISATSANVVKMLGQGDAANGTILLSSQPALGDVITLGLAGTETSYFFVDDFGSYFPIRLELGDPSMLGTDDLAITLGATDFVAVGTTATRHWKVGAAVTDSVAWSTAAAGVVRLIELLNIFVPGSAFAYLTSAGQFLLSRKAVHDAGQDMVIPLGPAVSGGAFTDSAAKGVLIGDTKEATAENLRLAIRCGDAVIGDASGAGSLYGIGIVANPDIMVIARSNALLTTEDRMASKRAVEYAYSSSTAAISIGVPVGGIDGDLVASFSGSSTVRTGVISLDDEHLDSGNIPPNTTFQSDWMTVGGRNLTLYLAASNVVTALAVSYEIATDTGHPGSPIALTSLDNNSYRFTPADRIEYLRLTIVNSNTAPASVNAKAVIG